jgi:hypothetical protein
MSIKVKAYLCGLGESRTPPVVREIEIPDSEILELAFRYGQNDFQPVDGIRSVSVGDIVELPNGRQHVVAPFGFLNVPTEKRVTRSALTRDGFVYSQRDSKEGSDASDV